MKQLTTSGKFVCALILTVAAVTGCKNKDADRVTPPEPTVAPAPAATPATPPATDGTAPSTAPAPEGGNVTPPAATTPAPTTEPATPPAR